MTTQSYGWNLQRLQHSRKSNNLHRSQQVRKASKSGFLYVIAWTSADKLTTKSCCRQSLTISAINYGGRASGLGGTIDLVDQRRSVFHALSVHLPRAKLTARSTIDMPWRNFLSPEFRKNSRRKYRYFCRYLNLVKSQNMTGRIKPPCQKAD